MEVLANEGNILTLPCLAISVNPNQSFCPARTFRAEQLFRKSLHGGGGGGGGSGGVGATSQYQFA